MNINNFIKFAATASNASSSSKQDFKLSNKNVWDNPKIWERKNIPGPVDLRKYPVVRSNNYPLSLTPDFTEDGGREAMGILHSSVGGSEKDGTSLEDAYSRHIPPKVLTQDERQKQFYNNFTSKFNNNPNNRFFGGGKLSKDSSDRLLNTLDYALSSRDNAKKLWRTLNNIADLSPSRLHPERNILPNLREENVVAGALADYPNGSLETNPDAMVNAYSRMSTDAAEKTMRYGSLWPILHANGVFTDRNTGRNAEGDSRLKEALNKLRELSKKYY